MLTPKEVAFEACKIGLNKVCKKNSQVIVSAMLAGLFIGLGYYGYLVLASGATGQFAFLGKFLGAAIFPVGLVLIIIAGGDLFTGNCLISLGCLNKEYKYRLLFKNLLLVFLGNFIGALFLVALIYFSQIGKDTKDYITTLATTKSNLNFIVAISRGILCNILVSLAVYISYAGTKVSDKILAAMLPVLLFVASGYEHVVANFFVMPLGYLFGGDFTLMEMLLNNFIPVTIGNFIGGSVIVPFAYYFLFVRGNKPNCK